MGNAGFSNRCESNALTGKCRAMVVEPELGPRLGVGRIAEVFSTGGDRVVKLYYPEFPEDVVQSEARAAEHDAKAGLPVPRFYGLV
jgi:hypothetical protein